MVKPMVKRCARSDGYDSNAMAKTQIRWLWEGSLAAGAPGIANNILNGRGHVANHQPRTSNPSAATNHKPPTSNHQSPTRPEHSEQQSCCCHHEVAQALIVEAKQPYEVLGGSQVSGGGWVGNKIVLVGEVGGCQKSC